VISSASQGCPYSRILSPSEDWELCASTTIARYGIEQSDSESSSSPLYTAPNTPSFSKRNSKDLEKPLMDSKPEDCVSRLESGLSKGREQARVQQNTLDHILQLLQQLPITGVPQAPQGPPTALPAPTVAALAAPALGQPARGLKPATPNDFDGDHLKGRAFLNSCRLYISPCESQFQDDQAKIHWALSFMKSGCAALHANCILQRETVEMVALTKLESKRYYQGWKLVDYYINEFLELVEEAGYSDGLSIVIKFRKGLDRDIQDRIVEMVQGRLEDDDPDGWYAAAQVLDANRAANLAFHGTQCTVAPTPSL